MKRIRHLIIVLLVAVMALTPTYAALAEAQATPVIEPIPTEEVIEPTITPEENIPSEPSTPTASTTPDIDTDVQDSELVSPLSVTGGGDLTECGPDFNTIGIGELITIECTLEFPGLGLLQFGRVYRPELPPGFESRIRISSTLSGVTATNLDFGGTYGYASVNLPVSLVNLLSVTIYFDIRTTSSALPGNSFYALFEACTWGALAPACSEFDSSVQVALDIPLEELAEGVHYTFSCDRPLNPEVPLQTAAVAECTVNATGVIRNHQIQLDAILVNTSQGDGELPGWDIQADELPDPLPRLGPGEDFNFEVRMTPVACAAGDASPEIEVGVNLTSMLGGIPIGGPASSSPHVVIASFAPEMNQTASISSGPGVTEVPFSLTPDTVSTPLTIAYDLSPCSPWQGYVQMSEFSPIGDDDSITVPIETTFTHVSTMQNPPDQSDVSNEAPDVIGTTETPVLSGTPPESEVTIEHTINLEYTIPANTPVGTYTSTITVTTSDAP